jgi:hypothetical protein
LFCAIVFHISALFPALGDAQLKDGRIAFEAGSGQYQIEISKQSEKKLMKHRGR